MEMKSMITNAPGNGALFAGGRRLICLTFNAQVHYMISTDSAVVHNDICNKLYDVFFVLNLRRVLVSEQTYPMPIVPQHSTRKETMNKAKISRHFVFL